MNHEVVPREHRLPSRRVGMDDTSLQRVPTIEHVVAVQDQRQVFLELRLRKGREETEVPEIHTENRDVSSGD